MARHIGLIDGIGPAATVVSYRTILRRFMEAGQPLALTIDHADLATLAANLRAGRAEEQAAIFARHAAALRGAGCDLVAVTALGGHFCRAEFAAASPRPPRRCRPSTPCRRSAPASRRTGSGASACWGPRP